MDQLTAFASWLGGSSPQPRSDGPAGGILDDTDEADKAERMRQLLQQYTVLLEYERLQDMVPPGMYVMPSYDSVLTWHGTIFARQGLYRGGVFKFEMYLPADYPESMPDLRFITTLFHPLVDPINGRVDMGAFFPEWRAGRDYASCALPHLHRALLRREYLVGGSRQPLNPEAKELFIKDQAAFAERAAACASQSLQRLHIDGEGSGLQFTEQPKQTIEAILGSLRSGHSVPLAERKSTFINWFLDHYMPDAESAGQDAVQSSSSS